MRKQDRLNNYLCHPTNPERMIIAEDGETVVHPHALEDRNAVEDCMAVINKKRRMARELYIKQRKLCETSPDPFIQTTPTTPKNNASREEIYDHIETLKAKMGITGRINGPLDHESSQRTTVGVIKSPSPHRKPGSHNEIFPNSWGEKPNTPAATRAQKKLKPHVSIIA